MIIRQSFRLFRCSSLRQTFILFSPELNTSNFPSPFRICLSRTLRASRQRRSPLTLLSFGFFFHLILYATHPFVLPLVAIDQPVLYHGATCVHTLYRSVPHYGNTSVRFCQHQLPFKSAPMSRTERLFLTRGRKEEQREYIRDRYVKAVHKCRIAFSDCPYIFDKGVLSFMLVRTTKVVALKLHDEQENNENT